MPRDDFARDDIWQRRVRDAVLGPGFYGPFSLDGRYVYIDKGRLATTLQKRYAVDTVLQRKNSAAVFIEEKIVRWPGRVYDALALETRSCTVPGHESEGWMKYGRADWLNYAMCQEDGAVLCYVIDFPKLQEVFWPAVESFKETVTDQRNHTACRIVPLGWIRARVGVFEKLIHATPDGADIVRQYNATHYKRGTREAA